MSKQAQAGTVIRRIWYVVAIVLSILVLLSSAAAIVGTWVARGLLSDVSVSLLGVVENTAVGLRRAGERLDQSLADMQSASSEIAEASAQISANVADKGLIAVLLPEEQEQKLMDRARSVQETVATIRDLLATGVGMYQTIDRLPFVNLPKPRQEDVAKIEQAVLDSGTRAEELRKNVREFRTGVSGEIGKVEQAALRLSERLDESRGRLAELDADLAALQDLAGRLKTSIPTALTIVAVLLTLFLAYVIYSQVEVIRIHVRRWQSPGR
jgi:hypothetical protein